LINWISYLTYWFGAKSTLLAVNKNDAAFHQTQTTELPVLLRHRLFQLRNTLDASKQPGCISDCQSQSNCVIMGPWANKREIRVKRSGILYVLLFFIFYRINGYYFIIKSHFNVENFICIFIIKWQEYFCFSSLIVI
jgi:hypothetical protein